LGLKSITAQLSDDVIRGMENMDAILDQFLAFVRDGSDEPVEKLDLGELVREVLAPYNQYEETVRLCLEPMPALALRRVSIKRLLVNLIANALLHRGLRVVVAALLA